MNHADVVMKNTLPTPEETSSGDFLSEVAEFCEQFTGTRLTHRTISAITNKCRDLMAKYGQPRNIPDAGVDEVLDKSYSRCTKQVRKAQKKEFA